MLVALVDVAGTDNVAGLKTIFNHPLSLWVEFEDEPLIQPAMHAQILHSEASRPLGYLSWCGVGEADRDVELLMTAIVDPGILLLACPLGVPPACAR